MFRIFRVAAVGLLAMAMLPTSAFAAATVKVLIAQEDWDKHSLKRNSRIQNAVLNTFSQTLHAPAYNQYMKKYGISGMDVYDETAVSLNFYKQDRVRRQDEELISLARSIKNPTIDVLALYTIYARAVKDPYTKVAKLQMSFNYRALDVKSGRYLGGDNLDIDVSGVPFTGCAAGLGGKHPDKHCVAEFVSQHAEKLARDAGNKLALQLAALLGSAYGTESAPTVQAPYVPSDKGGAPVAVAKPYGGPACANIPTTYSIVFRGFDQRQVNFIEANMSHWKCVLDLDTSESSFSEIRYEYKTRADQQRILRNIRIMTELLGVLAEPKTQRSNEIIVQALTLRHN